MDRILINKTEIKGSDLVSGQNLTAHAMVGETLSVDQLICVVNTEDQPLYPANQSYPLITADNHIYFSKNDIDVSALKNGDEVLYYSNQDLMGKYYIDQVSQTGTDRYKLSCVSIIGRLLNNKHYGGIYVGEAATLVFADLLQGVSYVIDADVAGATVTGYLPIASRRDNLQQLLMATGSTVRINSNGDLHVTTMANTITGRYFSDRIYSGGSVEVKNPVQGLKLTEHNYFPAGNQVTLFFDGVDGEELIEFREPYHDLTIEGGEIVESGANYARIRAKGTVTLTGQPYTHVTRIVTAGVIDSATTNTVKNVSNCFLANPQIAQALADRIFAYLQCNKTIEQHVLTGSERAGDVVSVINPYTLNSETATVRKIETVMSGTNKSKAEFLVGFVPQGALSGFKNYVILTGDGSWLVPEGVREIRPILVGAGNGGGGGYNGQKGQNGKWSKGPGSSYNGAGGTGAGGAGGSGGAAGNRGEGGKVFEISLSVEPLSSIEYSCGKGGVGGDANGGVGGQGTATLFGGYSSDYGRLYPYGYFEPKTNMTFSAAGEEGFSGGAGGAAESTAYSEWDEIVMYGYSGESVNDFRGGSGGRAIRFTSGVDDRTVQYYTGGGGGGAANGAAGGDGQMNLGGNGGSGKAGKDALNYGQGGGAGNGGGGSGGGPIGGEYTAIGTNFPYYYFEFPAGTPGSGGKGGNGGDGAIVVYY